MNPFTESMLERLESFGPQLFDLGGSLGLWIEIIGTLDTNSINSLLDLIENKSCDQKYEFAKRILIEGFDNVINASKQKTTTIEAVIDDQQEEEEEEEGPVDEEGLLTPDLSPIECNDSDNEQTDQRLIIDENENKNDGTEEDIGDEEIIVPLNQSSELLDTSDSYVDASEPLLMSPDSYKSALNSPDPRTSSSKTNSNSNVNKSLEILVESRTESLNVSENMSTSTPSRPTFEDRLSGQILSLSPITSLYSQSKQGFSPTVSLNLSTTSSHSSKSTVSSKASKRSPTKSTEKIIEEYKCLVPYESYCSEQKYFRSSNESNSQSESVISDFLYDNIIDENIKTIESNNS